MTIRNLSFVLLAGGCLAAAPGPVPDLASARRFVAGVYSHYPTAGRASVFGSTGKLARALFDPGLVALMAEDEKLAHGEVGALDSDPLCDCQDDDGLSFTIESAATTGPDRARFVVVRHDHESPPGTEKISLDLVVVAGRWRIRDIATPSTPSLRKYLADSNREVRNAPVAR